MWIHIKYHKLTISLLEFHLRLWEEFRWNILRFFVGFFNAYMFFAGFFNTLGFSMVFHEISHFFLFPYLFLTSFIDFSANFPCAGFSWIDSHMIFSSVVSSELICRSRKLILMGFLLLYRFFNWLLNYYRFLLRFLSCFSLDFSLSIDFSLVFDFSIDFSFVIFFRVFPISHFFYSISPKQKVLIFRYGIPGVDPTCLPIDNWVSSPPNISFWRFSCLFSHHWIVFRVYTIDSLMFLYCLGSENFIVIL